MSNVSRLSQRLQVSSTVGQCNVSALQVAQIAIVWITAELTARRSKMLAVENARIVTKRKS